MKTLKSVLLLFMITVFFTTCKKNTDVNNDCPIFSIVPHQPYDNPVWHPSGQIIGFNHRPIKEINYSYGYDCPMQASYTYEDDSAGFYLINVIGTNQRRALPYYLQTSAWSHDGQWIAFSNGGQIYKMPFDGEKFDTTAIVQLTFEGNNFSPAWSPDDMLITYGQSVCSGNIECGIWSVDVNTYSTTFLIFYGQYSDWIHNTASFIYSKNSFQNGIDIGDTIYKHNLANNSDYVIKFISTPHTDNRYFKYNPVNSSIAFCSTGDIPTENGIWLLEDAPYKEEQLLVSEATSFSWSPDGKYIIYMHRANNYRIDEEKGTLWVINVETKEKRQLTYNQFNLLIN